MAEHAEHDPLNPDPALYTIRRQLTLSKEQSETLGVFERWWDPREDGEDDDGGLCNKKPTLALRDLDGYRPLQLVFDRPPVPPGRDLTDDWYEQLLAALDVLVTKFGTGFFGEVADGGEDSTSPWADDALPLSFLLYCSDIACSGGGSGWDALLLDPVQRAALVRGVLARLLDEHVLSALLFGGTADQVAVLARWDRTTLGGDGFARKLKRCEEIERFFLGDGGTLTARFWADVDTYTAQAAQMLLPVLNLQRRLLLNNPFSEKTKTPGIRAFYQQLHDIVALAGYASLAMARSVSIFEVCFPEPGQLWDVDQVCDDDDGNSVYDAKARTADADHAPLRADRVKIVAWPRITRYKPRWNRARDTVKAATRTVLHKSKNVYYRGLVGDAAGGVPALELHEHVEQVRRAAHLRRTMRFSARCAALALFLCLLYLLLTGHAGLVLLRVSAVSASASQAAVEAARAALDHAGRLAGLVVKHVVEHVVEPSLAKLPPRAVVVGAMRRSA